MTRRPKPRGGAPLPHLPEAAIPLLGTVSDREVATRTGTTARVVAAHRKARRIKPVRSGPKLVAGATRDQRHSYWVSPEESAAIHLAIEVAQRPLSDVARELMLAWARAAEERVAAAALPLTEDVKRSIDAGWAPTDPPTT